MKILLVIALCCPVRARASLRIVLSQVFQLLIICLVQILWISFSRLCAMLPKSSRALSWFLFVYIGMFLKLMMTTMVCFTGCFACGGDVLNDCFVVHLFFFLC